MKKVFKWLGICLGAFILLIVIAGITLILFVASEMKASQTEMTAYHPFRSAEAKERFLKSYDERAKKWPVASESKMLDTSYGQTFVRISGSADTSPLVLLHGIGGSSLQWAPNIEAFSASYRVYAVDNIYDYGRSVYTRPIQTPDDFVAWLDELFDVLALGDNINLMGLSYGGWLTTQYALRFPDRLDQIVLVAPVCTVAPLPVEWIVRASLCMIPRRYFIKGLMYWMLEDAAKKDEASRMILETEVDNALLAVQSFKPKRLVNPTVLNDEELQSIKMPALFLVGENEKIYPADEAVERLNRVAPQIKTEIIPNAGHDLTFVQAEMVNKKVLEFLREP